MPDTTDNTAATETTAETVDTTATEATTATETAATETTATESANTTEATGLDALPESWANEIKRLRAENASDRTEAKKKAAQDATDALTKKLGEALGLIQGDEAPKPEEVIAKLTAERDETAQRETATAKQLRELIERDALREAAKTHAGDFNSLTDSKRLSAAIEALDHTADDYAAQVDAAVKAAITSDPKLKAQAATTASSVEHGGTVTQPAAGVDAFRKDRRESRGHTFN